ncbi:MAG: RNA-guided endonuclease TnpB family protein, partial [Cyclobacteriaceae bacterium]
MKLTAKVRLYPSAEQEELLKATLTEANAACNEISFWAWNNKTFGQYKIHHGTYHTIKGSFNLSAQVIVRCIAKVCDSYKLDKKRLRQFKPLGSIAYDSRILTWKFAGSPGDKQIVSIWTLDGRQKIP